MRGFITKCVALYLFVNTRTLVGVHLERTFCFDSVRVSYHLPLYILLYDRFLPQSPPHNLNMRTQVSKLPEENVDPIILGWLQVCLVTFLATLALVASHPKKDEETKQDAKKQDKRGLFDLGYGYGGGYGGGYEGYGLEGGFGLGGGAGIESHGYVKSVTIHKEVPVPVPHPVPYPVEKKIPVPVKVPYAVPVDRPYPVHVPKPYPVLVEKPYPVHIEKKVPYPVKVPIKVPVPHPYPVAVPKPVPYPVHKPVPVPVKVPVYVEKPYPVLVKGHEGGIGGFEFGGGFEGGHIGYGSEIIHH